MYLFNLCNQHFTHEPIYSITNDLMYCSNDCIPEADTNHPYSFEYFNLVSSYRYFTEETKRVNNLVARIELENEMELIIDEYQPINLGDSERLYYKDRIM